MSIERRTILNNETLIPVGMISIIFVFCMWLTNVWANGQSNTRDISEIKIQRKEDITEIKTQLEKLNEKMDRIINKQ
jgi:hypothetical protein